MINRKARTLALAAALLVLGVAIGHAPALRANYSNITDTTQLSTGISAQTIAASGTFTGRPFTALAKTVNQAVQIQGTGTSPNYKAELLITLDGTNYVKPEVGGDLGTFTDQNLHIIPVASPVSIGHEVKVTELGGANTITITEGEISQ